MLTLGRMVGPWQHVGGREQRAPSPTPRPVMDVVSQELRPGRFPPLPSEIYLR